MSGRLEKETQYENKSKELLKKLPQIATRYYFYFKSNSSSRTESSCFMYLSKLNIYFNYLKQNGIYTDSLLSYKRVKPADITMYLNYYRNYSAKKKSDSAVAVMFNAIKSFYNFLEDNDYIEKNPCNRLKAPKVNQQPTPVIMTKEEINKIKDYILYSEKTFYHNDENEEYWRLRDYLIFTLGCRTGLRCSAIAAIDISDINMDDNFFSVTEKGNVLRNIYFGDNTKEIIQKWIVARSRIMSNDTTPALFITKKRERISTNTIGYMIGRYASDVIPDKHITPHKMRSTCATNLWEETHDIYMVANQLGHKNLANTKRYTDIAESESRRVATILDEL